MLRYFANIFRQAPIGPVDAAQQWRKYKRGNGLLNFNCSYRLPLKS
jgi:hypothetical protein